MLGLGFEYFGDCFSKCIIFLRVSKQFHDFLLRYKEITGVSRGHLHSSVWVLFRSFSRWKDIDRTRYRDVEGYMREARQTITPPMPANLPALAEYLDTYPPMRTFYRGSAVGPNPDAENNEIVFIFITDKMMNIMNTVDELFIDGTFAVCVCNSTTSSPLHKLL